MRLSLPVSCLVPVVAPFLAPFLALLPTLAAAEPEYYRVSGVAYNDTLNIRAAPDGDSADIGDLSYDAQAIEVMEIDPSGRWGKIIYFEGNGWIAMRFLELDPVPRIAPTTLPVGLVCGGTEPFWDVRYTADSAIFHAMSTESETIPLQSAGPALGRRGFPALLTHAGPDGFTYSLIRPQICSDGMSDRDYPWAIDYILGDGTYLEGCCSLPLDDM